MRSTPEGRSSIRVASGLLALGAFAAWCAFGGEMGPGASFSGLALVFSLMIGVGATLCLMPIPPGLRSDAIGRDFAVGPTERRMARAMTGPDPYPLHVWPRYFQLAINSGEPR